MRYIFTLILYTFSLQACVAAASPGAVTISDQLQKECLRLVRAIPVGTPEHRFHFGRCMEDATSGKERTYLSLFPVANPAHASKR